MMIDFKHTWTQQDDDDICKIADIFLFEIKLNSIQSLFEGGLRRAFFAVLEFDVKY